MKWFKLKGSYIKYELLLLNYYYYYYCCCCYYYYYYGKSTNTSYKEEGLPY